MAARPHPVADMRVFDAYFTRADADRDGRISGSEAVAFFQGSGLPRNVLAQVVQILNVNSSDLFFIAS